MTKNEFVDQYVAGFFSTWSVLELQNAVQNPEHDILIPPDVGQIRLLGSEIWRRTRLN